MYMSSLILVTEALNTVDTSNARDIISEKEYLIWTVLIF